MPLRQLQSFKHKQDSSTHHAYIQLSCPLEVGLLQAIKTLRLGSMNPWNIATMALGRPAMHLRSTVDHEHYVVHQETVVALWSVNHMVSSFGLLI